MGLLSYTSPIHLRGITPLTPDEHYCFDLEAPPAKFFLQDGRLYARYILSSLPPEQKSQTLRVLVVEDADAWADASLLTDWIYEETYEIDLHLYHLWWKLVLSPGA